MTDGKTTLADIIGTCERAAIRMGLTPCAPPVQTLTDAQRGALKWLALRNGDGLFDKNGVLVAACEKAPVRRSTWNRLIDFRLIEHYRPGAVTGGRGRLRLTELGRGIAARIPDDKAAQSSTGDHP